ncbi:MalY/PatB family protein [Halofilum ochraceum]|uniref:MalY/PatB family protein n=1 Tax=Halofilum ochraceum TaxID=1611323 RepID=UPI000836AE1C|nr:PatB family C-S lyase [Halofilum ochraceum]
MHYDFDELIDRRGTASDKWDRFRERDVLPMWVADMDFRAPPAVLDALHERVDHGVFGYTSAPDELVDVTVSMLRESYGWQVEPEWLVWLPGLVPGIHLTAAAVGERDDAVATFTPVYPPFRAAPARAGRERIEVPLASADGTIDFDRLEAAVTERTRLLLLCNPQNPTGRVYRRDELEALAAFCERRDLIICSDEIHCALILDPERRHIPMATLGPDIARRTITLMAPSKTYNIAGLGCSLAIIPDPKLRRRFQSARAGFVPGVNALGFTAALAAWRDCDDWHGALIDYLRGNRDRVAAAIADHPRLRMATPEATYLAWLDARELGVDDPAAAAEAVGVGLSDGADFGLKGFLRLNFGCPRSTLEEGLRRLARL